MNRQELIHLKQLVTDVEFEKSRISDLLHMVQASLNTVESDALVMKQKYECDLLQVASKIACLHNESFSSLDHLEAELQQLNSGNHDLTQEIVKLATDIEVGYESQFRGSKALCNGYSEKLDSTGSYSLLHDKRNDHHIGRLISKTINIGNDVVTIDKGESSIISNILSIDFDPWDDSITSPYNIVKLLSDNTDSQPGPLKNLVLGKFKIITSQGSLLQGRKNLKFKLLMCIRLMLSASNSLRATHSISVWQKETFIANGFPTSNFEEAENISNAHSIASSNKLSVISRAQVSAPPGFSIPRVNTAAEIFMFIPALKWLRLDERAENEADRRDWVKKVTADLLEHLPALQQLLYRVVSFEPQGAAVHKFCDSVGTLVVYLGKH
ncbi:hypothetical protein KIW84_055475 [Lathyrus oleraceus]|uniref:Uncharacterized protein n=1 Tax=Pisum sativum TaxID=3888 RepID=A0A9D4WY60_PEA|nr:hypothetical protein KIW84_055475 [Pisum sativum]